MFIKIKNTFKLHYLGKNPDVFLVLCKKDSDAS